MIFSSILFSFLHTTEIIRVLYKRVTMGTCEDYTSDNYRQNLSDQQQPKLGFTSYTNVNVTEEESLARIFENVRLNSNENVSTGDDHNHSSGNNSCQNLPIRPYAGDCPYYLRTGTCKFGLSCKYNHPLKRTDKVNYDRNNEGFSDKSGQIECKLYDPTSAWIIHALKADLGELVDTVIAQPIGPKSMEGEKECPFYMRNGSCGYGASCRFHHPDPTTVGGADTGNSTLGGYSIGQFNHSSGNFDGGYSMGQPAQAAYYSPMLSDMTSPYQNNCSSYMPSTALLPQGAAQSREWNVHQPHGGSNRPYLHRLSKEMACGRPLAFLKFPGYSRRTTGRLRSAVPPATEIPVMEIREEYPERPGRRECALYMKTGECMFKSECPFHHPKDRPPTTPLNEKLLPLRPDKPVCPDYEHIGLCKWGPSCKYNHPDIYAAKVPPRPQGSANTIMAPWTAWNLEDENLED
ncbi:hypothetical protein LguiB_011418 [Lonicera macranthoides]